MLTITVQENIEYSILFEYSNTVHAMYLLYSTQIFEYHNNLFLIHEKENSLQKIIIRSNRKHESLFQYSNIPPGYDDLLNRLLISINGNH